MKRLAFFLLLSAVLSGCTAFRAVRCGSPTTDTYLNFPLDTIACSPDAPEVLISSPDHDRFFEDTRLTVGPLNNETIADYFSRARGDGALLIVRNDTILLEHYYGDFSPL